MALQDKYKGKSFAKVAEEINNTYKDRFDPISIRGLNSEMKSLEEAQEYVKQKQAIEANLEAEQQQQANPSQQQGQVNPIPPTAGNEGIGFQPTEQEETFKREASSDYNEKFADGGNMFAGGGALGLALQAAPLLIDGLQLATLKEEAPVERHTVNGDITSALSKFKPRESRFENIDFNNIERGITESSARFTQNNVNASRGNAGSFMANELANSANLSNAIGKARMGAQVEDRKTDQLNAAEKARVDRLNLRKNTTVAGLELNRAKFNSQVNTRADDTDAANRAAFESAKADLQSSMGTNIATIGKTLFDNARLSKLYGYDILGNYKNGSEEEKQKAINDTAEVAKVTPEEAAQILDQELEGFETGNVKSDFSKGGSMSSKLKKVRKKAKK